MSGAVWREVWRGLARCLARCLARSGAMSGAVWRGLASVWRGLARGVSVWRGLARWRWSGAVWRDGGFGLARSGAMGALVCLWLRAAAYGFLWLHMDAPGWG